MQYTRQIDICSIVRQGATESNSHMMLFRVWETSRCFSPIVISRTSNDFDNTVQLAQENHLFYSKLCYSRHQCAVHAKSIENFLYQSDNMAGDKT